MDTLFKDLRHGARMLRASPAFAVIAVVTLALGIGGNTAIFSLVNAVLLGKLPFREPERLLMIWEDASFAGFPRNDAAPANYADWRAQKQAFEDVAAVYERGFNLTGDGEPQKIVARAVTAGFFPFLGVAPQLGRVFQADEDRPGGDRVVIVSH